MLFRKEQHCLRGHRSITESAKQGALHFGFLQLHSSFLITFSLDTVNTTKNKATDCYFKNALFGHGITSQFLLKKIKYYRH
jgi:hypothetical protein